MTKKRFTIADYPTDIIDSQSGEKYPCSSYGTHMEIICDLLNELSDENEQLKEENKGVKEVLIDLKKIDSFWDSALLQEHIDKIANILGVDLE